ncbi:MAG TPA: hypothetical protein VII73_10105 [Caulobacteraceae bacterium]
MIAVVGMATEARIIAGPGLLVIISGGRPESLSGKFDQALADRRPAILSFGLCGALDGALKPGDLLIGTGAVIKDRRVQTDVAWTDRLARSLPQARRAEFAGTDAFIVDALGKAALRATSGAAAVDTESHVAARFAERTGAPFAIVRAVSDPANRTLPNAAQVGLRADGRADLAAVLASLARNPGQLPSLLRVALEARAGLSALRRCAYEVRSAAP